MSCNIFQPTTASEVHGCNGKYALLCSSPALKTKVLKEKVLKEKVLKERML